MLGTFPLGRYQEQRLAVSSAEHTREASTIQLDRLEHLSPFTHAHAMLASHVGVPESPFGIEANPVRMICTRLGPDSPMGEAAVGGNSKGREPIAVGLSHDQR
jgi:hypothetical protein